MTQSRTSAHSSQMDWIPQSSVLWNSLSVIDTMTLSVGLVAFSSRIIITSQMGSGVLFSRHPSLHYYEYKIGSSWAEFLLLSWTCQLRGFNFVPWVVYYTALIWIILIYKWSMSRYPHGHGLGNETTKINKIITPRGHLAYYTHLSLWWLGYFTDNEKEKYNHKFS